MTVSVGIVTGGTLRCGNYTGKSTKCKNENQPLSGACGMVVKHLGSSWLACFGLDLQWLPPLYIPCFLFCALYSHVNQDDLSVSYTDMLTFSFADV